jgi:signal transduction histidine kinase
MRNGPARSIFRRMTSIRGKITAGYALGFLFLLVFASILFANLLVVEDRIGSYSGISRFLDTTLEMRRYEKNYLLYGKQEDLEAAIEYAASATSIIAGDGLGGGAGASRNPAWLRLVAGVDREAKRLEFSPDETARLLNEYVALLRDAGRMGVDPPEPVVTAIRDLGRKITRIAERLSSVEGQNIQEILRSGRRKIIVLVVLFLLGSAFIARMVRTTALRPLKELETGMQRIASGELRMLPVGSANDEIESMNAAFNRMIGEIFEHREEVMRSERLASLGTMLAGIAHEINNPLSNISTSAELLEEANEELGPEERQELIRQVISQTDRATEIIRTVLEYSREPQGDLDRRPTNLLSALFESVILVRGELPTHVSVALDVAPDIEVLAHKTKLQQAFINLMTNSIHAMREAHRDGTIAVSARYPPGDGQVEIVFRDTGAGISPHVIDRIFDPFFSTKDVGHGTGLGLYLTHQIVEHHGGTIRVESTVGEGTTVTIRLPRIDATAGGELRPQGGAGDG